MLRRCGSTRQCPSIALAECARRFLTSVARGRHGSASLRGWSIRFAIPDGLRSAPSPGAGERRVGMAHRLGPPCQSKQRRPIDHHGTARRGNLGSCAKMLQRDPECSGGDACERLPHRRVNPACRQLPSRTCSRLGNIHQVEACDGTIVSAIQDSCPAKRVHHKRRALTDAQALNPG